MGGQVWRRALTAAAFMVATTAVPAAASPASPADAAPVAAPPAGLRGALDQAVADGYPAAIGYARIGDARWRVAAGVADRATGEPARPGDRFRIASSTKAFVSTVVLQLVGEGRLSLDDTVERWLPGVVHGNGNDGTRVTVRQLLNHTSGIWDPTRTASFWDPYLRDHDRGYGYRPRDVVAMAVAHRPDFPSGTSWQYSNTNYLLAGLVVEAVTRHSAVSEVYRRIIHPLRLTHTSFPVTDPDIHGRHLHGYDLSYRDVTRFSPSYDWTAGAMISTLDDLSRFHRALFGGELLRAAQQRELQTTVPMDDSSGGYGLGVQRSEVPCPAGSVPVWQTDGGGPGFTSIAVTSADGSRQLVLAANAYDIGRELRGLPPVPASRSLAVALTAVMCS